MAKLAELLNRWQADSDPTAFDSLCCSARPLIEQAARKALRRRIGLDPSAIDEAVSRVFCHLMQLSPRYGAAVARFEDRGTDDAGEAYVRWLARNRALDLARKRTRHDRHETHVEDLPECVSRSDDADEPDRHAAVLQAAEALPARDREVIHLLLAGLSQAEIADRLGLCRGTISRIQARAVGDLRSRLRVPK